MNSYQKGIYALGKVFDYLQSIEAPEWVMDIINEYEAGLEETTENPKAKGGRRKQQETTNGEDAGSDAQESENEEEDEREPAGKDDGSRPIPPSSGTSGHLASVKEMLKAAKSASEMSVKLGLTISQVYALRSRARKELEEEGWAGSGD